MPHPYYWSAESWGAYYPPENESEIVYVANSWIDDYITENDLDPITDAEQIKRFSEKLWGEYCSDPHIFD